MSSAAKTLDLLSHFSETRPEIGLSQLCRLAGRDKATTYRHVQALEAAGFVEQNPASRAYRLGPALLQLAQLRERTVPRKAGVEQPLKDLAAVSGETVHATILSGTVLYALAQVESVRHSARVLIDVQTFPFHATASGICALAFGPPDLMDHAVRNLTRFTSETVIDADALALEAAAAQKLGFAHSSGGYERDVHSVAAPVFDQTAQFAGTVTVAGVAARMTEPLIDAIHAQLAEASREISRNWGGRVPPEIEAAWTDTLAGTQALEPAQ
ncbi:IclR family transcriptional regulator [Hasllibacter sp. MH4015]|uniref:IclR family transcriptional regulator n=1 Tax=Hasllibacter sp. MH4015 TaxID=2854029 RepID=UPI001CD1FAAF|nr:IclR family transcriptional regulator [Hasllibacter sp. MH4015]